MATIQRFGGGAAGLGGSLAARQFLDEPSQSRFTQPSVLYGLGSGALATAMWYADFDVPMVEDDFWASHAMTSIPAGAFFLAFPKKSGQNTVEQVREALRGQTGGNRQRSAEGERVRVQQRGGDGFNRPR